MEIIFLGTGPVGGIKREGKSARFESSIILKGGSTNILVDVTNFFSQQVKLVDKVDSILITHAHKDAIGGINQLVSWLGRKSTKRIPLFSHSQTLKKIGEHLPKTTSLILTAIKSGHKFKIDPVTVTPFMIRHSIQPGFPTLGFQLSLNGKKLVYVSDTGSWDEKAERLMKNADILVIDGAMWAKLMIAHLDIKEILPKICKWPVKKIIFTQIGHTVPKHEILQKGIKKICPKAFPAYDGMKVEI